MNQFRRYCRDGAVVAAVAIFLVAVWYWPVVTSVCTGRGTAVRENSPTTAPAITETTVKKSPAEAQPVATNSTAKPPALPPAECSDPTAHATSFEELSLAYDGEGEFSPEYVTPAVKELVGERVCLRGWISATSVRGQKSASFVLVRHNGKCCFGQGAPPSDNIQVTMDPGGLVAYTEAPIQVEGILSLRPWTGPDGLVWSVYHLQASAAKP